MEQARLFNQGPLSVSLQGGPACLRDVSLSLPSGGLTVVVGEVSLALNSPVMVGIELQPTSSLFKSSAFQLNVPPPAFR